MPNAIETTGRPVLFWRSQRRIRSAAACGPDQSAASPCAHRRRAPL
eukprot:CAMPEP_0183535650 /NCGR_PEP_ID=MMETSP0371-20130417/27704_1 /TAXON_ID=268820 /ORGANISM="Peridinium aciculiferum, Strain PAER-2" /LENGTH=45 /DNA_ID= /DNA_START= /DNA_END= /DNA_ORIENTATION=